MLEPPDLSEDALISQVEEAYGLRVAQLTFLPLGADVNTAVYRVVTQDDNACFLKLRKGPFDEISVALPAFLKAQGVQEVIAPLEARSGQPWARLEPYRMILYPFVEGRDGYETSLSDAQWQAFGAALQALHSAALPPALLARCPREDFNPRGRELVAAFQAQVEQTRYTDPTAARLAAFMRAHRAEISQLVERADQLAAALQARRLDFVPCHSDVHPGNLLIGAAGDFYIVDWDNPILAPKERDLMFIGSSSLWSAARQKELFYQGYGPAQIDPAALAYYRYERIVQDIAEFCEQLLASDEGGADREQSYGYFTGQFLPGQEVALARQSDPAGPEN